MYGVNTSDVDTGYKRPTFITLYQVIIISYKQMYNFININYKYLVLSIL